jgi:hypothetical protein
MASDLVGLAYQGETGIMARNLLKIFTYPFEAIN